MEIGTVRSVDIDSEMQQAYLDYAMSVIVSRALPDARDGLKPVHRRILFAMYDMGLRPEGAPKKSARIVGEVLGKYHPHGDMAVYETMARMAQDFSMRYLLVDGQGNFGSVDGDPPAAMRYTEARLTRPAMHLLADIGKNTVEFESNFDGTLQQPTVMPAALPNLLVNGATGIAVGMSTSIPPHNLGEVVDALTYMLDRWENLDDISVEDLMQFIQGPDFPTGGILLQGAEEEGLKAAYGTGRGKVIVQSRAHIEEMSRGRNRIIVTELPYMTNKASLIERIAELAREGRLEGVADLRDESDRHGLRIVIELTKTAEPEAVLRELHKSTPMRSTFGIIMLALVDGEPRLLSLKQALRVYLDHRLVVIRRRAEFELERARARAHILEGLRVALKNLDEVIDIIRKAPDVETARTRLMKRFKISEIQAQAILDMPLRRLAALERKKIEEEYKEVIDTIKDLEGLLKSAKRMRGVVAEELRQVKEAYGDRRRTQILAPGQGNGHLSLLSSELAPDKAVWVSVTRQGLISRSIEDTPPVAAGPGAAPRLSLRVNTRDILFLVNDRGEAAGLPVHALPEAADPSGGVLPNKVSPLGEYDPIAAIFTLPPAQERQEGNFVLTASRQGLIKKTAVTELPGPTARTFILMKINEGDRFGWARLTDGSADVLLATASGMAIRFSEEEVRPMGLVAAGVNAIKLGAQDEVVGCDLIDPNLGALGKEAFGKDVLLVAADGRAKRVTADQFPRQGRYGQGVVAWKLPRGSSVIGMGLATRSQTVALHTEKQLVKYLAAGDVPSQARAATGKPVLALKSGDTLQELVLSWDLSRKEPPASPTAGKAKAPKAATPAKKAEKEPAKTKASKEKAIPASPIGDGKAAAQGDDKSPKKSAVAKPTLSGKTASAAAATPEPKAPVKKSAAVKTPVQSAPEKSAPAKKTLAKATPAPGTPAKKTPARSTPDKSTPAPSTPAKKTPAKGTPAKSTPAPSTPAKKTPAKSSPAEGKPAAGTPAKKAPAKSQPASKKPATRNKKAVQLELLDLPEKQPKKGKTR